MGVIRSTDKSMTNIQYKVDDMTGAPMDVKQWVDTEVCGTCYTLPDRFPMISYLCLSQIVNHVTNYKGRNMWKQSHSI